MGFIIHFYIIFGTNLLTGGPAQIAFFAYFSVSQKRNIKRNPNGTKPLRGSFLEQMQSRRLEVEVKEAMRRPRGRAACPGGRRATHPRGPHGALATYFFRLYILLYPENIQGSHEITFPLPNLLYPWDPVWGPFPVICQRGIRWRRASTSTP